MKVRKDLNCIIVLYITVVDLLVLAALGLIIINTNR